MKSDEDSYLRTVYSAMQTRDIRLITDVFRHNSDLLIRHKNHLGESLLHLAVKHNFAKIIDTLVQNGLDVDSTDSCDRTALHFAVTARSEGMVRSLLKHNASTSIRNIYGKSPLHLAVNFGDIRTIELMLISGADATHCTSSNQQTSLHIALRNEDEATFKLLLKHHSGNLNMPDMYGETLLHILARQKSSSNLAKLLVDRGVDVNVVNEDNETALHLAIHHRNVDTCKLLVESCADVNVKNKYGESPLHLAVRCKDVELVKLILNFGADVDQRANDGDTIVHIAVNYYNCDILEFLARSQADINAKNANGLSAFHASIKIKNIAAARQLFHYNVDVNTVAFGKFTPKGEPKSFTPLHTAIVQKDLPIVKFLLENGALLSDDDREIFLAVEFGCVGIVDLLLQYGANVNAKKLLFAAMKSRDKDKVELLLSRGADRKNVNETGGEDDESALHLVVKARDVKFVKFLLDIGMDVNIIDKNEATALCFAEGKIAELIVAKLALLKATGCFVCNKNESLTSTVREFSLYFAECMNEIERIKLTKYGEVSLIEFLRNDVKFWGRCVRKGAFDTHIDENLFPIYWEKLLDNVNRGSTRWNRKKRVRDALCEIQCFQQLYDVLDDIVDNLGDDELRDFVRRLEEA